MTLLRDFPFTSPLERSELPKKAVLSEVNSSFPFSGSLLCINSFNSLTFVFNCNNLFFLRAGCNKPGDLILSDNFQKLLCVKN